MRIAVIGAASLALLIVGIAHSADKKFGIEGKPAPTWEVSEWINLPAEKTALDLSDYEGKVLYLTFFQTMCPGCHQHGLPSLNYAIERYRDNPEVAFVAIQTAFERFDKNDLDGVKKTAKEFGLSIPMGHQGVPGTPAPILWTYDAGGTPWTIVIDKQGRVRFNDFTRDFAFHRSLVQHLLSES